MNFIEVVINAVPEFFEWLYDEVQVLVTATPDYGDYLTFIMVVGGGALVLFMGYEYMFNS